MISIISGLRMIMGLDVHPNLSRRNHGEAEAAQNNAEDDHNGSGTDSDSDDDDYAYVLDLPDNSSDDE